MSRIAITHIFCGDEVIEEQRVIKQTSNIVDVLNYLQNRLLAGIIDAFVILENGEVFAERAGIKALKG